MPLPASGEAITLCCLPFSAASMSLSTCACHLQLVYILWCLFSLPSTPPKERKVGERSYGFLCALCFSTCVEWNYASRRPREKKRCLGLFAYIVFFYCLTMSALVNKAKITLEVKAREYSHSLGSVKCLEVAEEFNKDYTLCNGFQETQLHSIHQD